MRPRQRLLRAARELQQSMKDAQERLERAEAQASVLRDRIAETGVARVALGAEQAEDLLERAKAAWQAEQDLQQAIKDAERAAADLQEVSAQIWATSARDTPPTRDELERLAEALDRLHQHQSRLEGLDAASPGPDPGASAGGLLDEGELQEARQLLRAWLRAPRPLVASAEPNGPASMVLPR